MDKLAAAGLLFAGHISPSHVSLRKTNRPAGQNAHRKSSGSIKAKKRSAPYQNRKWSAAWPERAFRDPVAASSPPSCNSRWERSVEEFRNALTTDPF